MLITTERRRFRTTADRRNRIPQRPPPFSRRRSLSRRINPDCRRLYPYNDRSTSFPPSDEFPGTRVIRTRALALLCRHNVSPLRIVCRPTDFFAYTATLLRGSSSSMRRLICRVRSRSRFPYTCTSYENDYHSSARARIFRTRFEN